MGRRMLFAATAAFIFLFSTINLSAQTPQGDWVADVAEKVLPSVVNIASVKTVVIQHSPFFSDPFFREFFGGDMPVQERMQRALGSGVILTADGYIVTNNHVVGGADRVEVRLSDERVFPARIIGTDPKSDVAIIKIDGPELPAIAIGDSSKLRIGSFVLAVGNPFGLEQTVTMGIISALGRSGLGITDYENFIQTDAAINPGNSGGALVNMKGELIGINTAILSRTGGSVGIGFAIPINLVMNIQKSLVAYGKVVRGWLGVSVQDITADMAQAMDITTRKGVLVAEVTKDSPAQKAGMKAGDIIVEINGSRVGSTSSLRFLVSEIMPGTKADIKIIRGGKGRMLGVTIGDLSGPSVPQQRFAIQDNRFLGGATVIDITTLSRNTMQIDRDVKGVLVVDVMHNTPAAKTGIRPGDVIVAINSRETKDLASFKQILGKLGGHKMGISIYRQGLIMNMTIIR